MYKSKYFQVNKANNWHLENFDVITTGGVWKLPRSVFMKTVAMQEVAI